MMHRAIDQYVRSRLSLTQTDIAIRSIPMHIAHGARFRL